MKLMKIHETAVLTETFDVFNVFFPMYRCLVMVNPHPYREMNCSTYFGASLSVTDAMDFTKE